MATKAQKVKSNRYEMLAKKNPHKKKYRMRHVNRCFKCGRRHGYLRAFKLCRICFRELASQGMISGVRKSSW